MRPYILLVLALLPITVASQSLSSRLDSLLQKFHAQGYLHGTVLVAKAGKVVYTGQFGMANRQFNVPVTAATRFPMASITKLFGAVLALQLQEAGQLDLDSPIGTYIPDLLPQINQQVTVRQLLLHTSGLPGDKIADYYTKSIKRPGTLVRNNVKDSLEATPGSRFKYNNIDYIVLGAILEKVSGKKWGQLLEEKIITPLGLKNTGVVVQQNIIPSLAYGYHNYSFGTGNAADTLYNDESPFFENYATAGALYTTAEDLFKVDQALYSGQLLNAVSIKEMYTPVESLGYNRYARGYPALGSYINRIKGLRGKGDVSVVERRGNINGFNSTLLRCVEDRNTVIMLCNTDTGNMEMMGDAVLRLLYSE